MVRPQNFDWEGFLLSHPIAVVVPPSRQRAITTAIIHYSKRGSVGSLLSLSTFSLPSFISVALTFGVNTYLYLYKCNAALSLVHSNESNRKTPWYQSADSLCSLAGGLLGLTRHWPTVHFGCFRRRTADCPTRSPLPTHTIARNSQKKKKKVLWESGGEGRGGRPAVQWEYYSVTIHRMAFLCPCSEPSNWRATWSCEWNIRQRERAWIIIF